MQSKEELIDIFLPMLSKERFEKNDGYKIDIASVIFKILGKEGIDKFILFSLECSVIEEKSTNIFNMSKMYENDLSIKTLAWYAKQDSPEEYNVWENSILNIMFEEHVLNGMGEYEFLYYFIWLDVVVINKTFYHFKSNRLISERNNHTITKEIQKKSNLFIRRKIEEIRDKLEQNVKIEERKFEMINLRTLDRFLHKINNINYLEDYLKRMRCLFYCKTIYDHYSEKHNRLCFTNLLTINIENKIFMIDLKPEDYIISNSSIHLYNLKGESSINYGFLNEMFPNSQIRDYALKELSSFIWGNERKIIQFVGVSLSGKSFIMDVIGKIVGEQCFMAELRNQRPINRKHTLIRDYQGYGLTTNCIFISDKFINELNITYIPFTSKFKNCDVSSCSLILAAILFEYYKRETVDSKDTIQELIKDFIPQDPIKIFLKEVDINSMTLNESYGEYRNFMRIDRKDEKIMPIQKFREYITNNLNVPIVKEPRNMFQVGYSRDQDIRYENKFLKKAREIIDETPPEELIITDEDRTGISELIKDVELGIRSSKIN